jgi:hypothetical protein
MKIKFSYPKEKPYYINRMDKKLDELLDYYYNRLTDRER